MMLTLEMLITLFIIVLAVFIISKLASMILKALAVAICLFLIGSVFFGDGHEIVQNIASYFDNGDSIIEMYEDYKDRDSDLLQGVDTDKIKEDTENLANDAKDIVVDKWKELVDNSKGKEEAEN